MGPVWQVQGQRFKLYNAGSTGCFFRRMADQANYGVWSFALHRFASQSQTARRQFITQKIFPMPQAQISDLDGNLANTEAVHSEAFNHVFPQAGADWHGSHEGHDCRTADRALSGAA